MGKPPPPKGNRPARNTKSQQPKKQAATTNSAKAIKKSASETEPLATTKLADNPISSLLSLADQQRILNIFSETFDAALKSSEFANTLQAVKQGLFDRDFEHVFGDEAYLRVYAARYSPTRALGYAEVLCSIDEHLRQLDKEQQRLETISIGGGAAEVVAIAAYLSQVPQRSGSIVLVDSGPWGDIVDSLAAHVVAPPTLPQWANAEAKANNHPLLEPSRLEAKFLQKDVLVSSLDDVFNTPRPCLVTLFFTLNELFTAGGIGKATAFLLNLSSAVPSGSLLLVVDSPGSYSETKVGKDAKKYPMLWLLDKVLSAAEGCTWDKIESHESRWFRLPERLVYPIPLENMRYQIHLYRVTK